MSTPIQIIGRTYAVEVQAIYWYFSEGMANYLTWLECREYMLVVRVTTLNPK